MDNLEILGPNSYFNYELGLNGDLSMITEPKEFCGPQGIVWNSIKNVQLWNQNHANKILTIFFI